MERNMRDLIERQDVIDAIGERPLVWNEWTDEYELGQRNQYDSDKLAVETVPSAEPTLYGYSIEHLAYIARVMEKEGITAEYAVRTFDDMSRAIRMIIEEAQQKAEEMLNGRFNQQAGGD